MQISRRTMIGGGAALLLAGQAGIARASLASDHWSQLRPILARHWRGSGTTSTAGTTDGELALHLQLDIVPDDDLHFGGQLQLMSNWDTGTYRATYVVRGYIWSTDDTTGVMIESTSLSSGDALPSELYWQGLTGKLRLYIEQGASDQWLLDGTLYGTRDGNAFDTQLSDRS